MAHVGSHTPSGLITVKPEDHLAERERVFGFDWFAIYPPEIHELEKHDLADGTMLVGLCA